MCVYNAKKAESISLVQERKSGEKKGRLSNSNKNDRTQIARPACLRVTFAKKCGNLHLKPILLVPLFAGRTPFLCLEPIVNAFIWNVKFQLFKHRFFMIFSFHRSLSKFIFPLVYGHILSLSLRIVFFFWELSACTNVPFQIEKSIKRWTYPLDSMPLKRLLDY